MKGPVLDSVGWRNAPPSSIFLNMRKYATAIDYPDEPVGSVMCLLVPPEDRGKSVAAAPLFTLATGFIETSPMLQRVIPQSIRSRELGRLPGRRELQVILEHVCQSRLQDPSSTGTFRDCEKTALTIRVLSS